MGTTRGESIDSQGTKKHRNGTGGELKRSSSRRTSNKSKRNLSNLSSRPSSLYPKLDGEPALNGSSVISSDFNVPMEEEKKREEDEEEKHQQGSKGDSHEEGVDPFLESVRSSLSKRRSKKTLMYPDMGDSLYPDVSSIKESPTPAAPSTLPAIPKGPPLSSAVAYAVVNKEDDDTMSSDLGVTATDVNVETGDDEEYDRKPPARKTLKSEKPSSSRRKSKRRGLKSEETSKKPATVDDAAETPELNDDIGSKTTESDGGALTVTTSGVEGEEQDAHKDEHRKKKKKKRKKKKKEHSSSGHRKKSSNKRANSLPVLTTGAGGLGATADGDEQQSRPSMSLSMSALPTRSDSIISGIQGVDIATLQERVATERAREPRSTTPGAVMVTGSGHGSQRTVVTGFVIPPSSTENEFLSEDDRARKTLTPPQLKVMMDSSDDDSSSQESTITGYRSHDNRSKPSSVDEEEGIVKATMVDDEIVPEAEAVTEKRLYRRRYACLAAIVLAAVGIAVGLSVGLSKSGSDKSNTVFVETTPSPTVATFSPTAAPTVTPPPTLESVVAADVLRCGVTNKIGFSIENQITGTREGFDVDLCRAVAAAVLGDPDKIEAVVVSGSERFFALRDDRVDLLARVTTHTMERDVYEKNALIGFSFSAPYLYDGLGFGGVPEFVTCADRLTTFGDCVLLTVCVLESTTHIDVLKLRLPIGSLIPVDSRATLYQNLIGGVCNVIAADQFDVATQIVRNAGYDGPYQVGSHRFSKEPLAMVVRKRDPQWHDFVSWTFQSLLLAEASGITSSTADLFPVTSAFGEEFQGMYRNAVRAVGNYGEIYDRHLQAIVPREGLNTLNTAGDTGLVYSFPFGSIDGEGPEPTGTLAAIREYGKLRCAIIQRPGMGELSADNDWRGLDADYCRAVAAAIFLEDSVDTALVEFLPVQDSSVGLSELSTGSVDVLAGGELTYLRDVNDPSTETGFYFSPPYFYYPTNQTSTLTGSTIDPLYGETLSLVTLQDDSDWADFCYWIVHATFFAEEWTITQDNANRMPEVCLYGGNCTSMFRDVIGAVGNYGEMYSRSVEGIFPRENSSNALNINPVGPQQYPLPGLL